MKSSSATSESLRTLIEALPSPVWARDIAGALTFVNAAYARAVEAKDAGRCAGARRSSCSTRAARDEASRARAAGKHLRGAHARDRRRQPAQLRRARRADPQAAAPASASTPPKPRRCARELNRLNDAHRRTLDQLATGVAIFTADQRLTFYNAAYRSLWELDAGFLDQNPTDSAVLDQLRAARKLPEEKDFREWKAALHEAYRATEAAGASSGICPTAAPCASSPRPIRRAA